MDESTDKYSALNGDDWSLILFALFMDDMLAKDKAWSEFEHELIYQNRFSSNHPIVTEIHNKASRATFILQKGRTLYRARVFKQSQYMNLVSYYLEASGVSKEEIDKQLSSINDWEKYFALIPTVISELNQDTFLKTPETISIISAYKKWRNLRYKGYDAKNSISPSADHVSAGRANPDHIRYLYLSEDEKTPVYEVRPIIGQTVSIARFRVKKDLKIFDLSMNLDDEYQNPEYSLPSLYNSIGKMFSKPYSGKETEYIPTQYLTEEIKRMGFDGIRFKSSLNEGGFNIVLFSDEYCKPYRSDLVTIRSITLGIEQPAIYHLLDNPTSFNTGL